MLDRVLFERLCIYLKLQNVNICLKYIINVVYNKLVAG